MILVTYWLDGERRGWLCWREPSGSSPVALGGDDPGDLPPGVEPWQALTVVTKDGGDRRLTGWIHPEQLAEIAGQDSPAVAEQMADQQFDDRAAEGLPVV